MPATTHENDMRFVENPETGERWYYLKDVCGRLGLTLQHQKHALPEAELKPIDTADLEAQRWEHREGVQMAVSPAGVLRLMAGSKRDEALDLTTEMFAACAANLDIFDKAVSLLNGVETVTPKQLRHVGIDDVRRWLKQREEGKRWAQIAREAGRSRGLIKTYCDPKTAPKFVRLAIWPE